LLYVLHDIDEGFLEVVELTSFPFFGERFFKSLAEFFAPRRSNIEGCAMVPASDADNWCLLTDDTNKDGAALMLFGNFNHSTDLDGDSLPDAWEIAHLSSTTVSDGLIDSDGDHFVDAHEYVAETSPTDPTSMLALSRIEWDGSMVTLEWASVAGRTYGVPSVTSETSGFTLFTNAIPATPPVNPKFPPDFLADAL